MITLFQAGIYNPLYNALVFFISVVPFADVGLAVITLTILVKIILFPLARNAIKTQVVMKRITPDIEKVKEKYKNQQHEQAQKLLALYRENGIRPLAGILILLIQLPIIIGLYWVFFRGGLPSINTDILYVFTPIPEMVNMQFFGVVDMGGRSIVLAALAGITQFLHARMTIRPQKLSSNGASFKDDLARSFQMQLVYVLPVVVAVAAYIISAAIALYFLTSNIFTLAQEYVVRRSLPTTDEPETNSA